MSGPVPEPGRLGGTADQPARFFADDQEFRRWLEQHHETATELWMGLNKKHVPDRGLTWDDAVPQALCFGWIDSKIERIDEDAVRQRWTPRKAGSTWSAVNVAHVERLTAAGLMEPAGVAAFEARRPDRIGIYTYEQPPQVLPDAYAAALAADPAATAFWDVATASYRRTCVGWVLSAKQESTRERRMAQLVADSASGQLIPTQRYGQPPAWLTRAADAAVAASIAPTAEPQAGPATANGQ